MALATNVARRGSVYYYRVRVPERLKAIVGRRELWRSLRTSEWAKARGRAALLPSLTERLWRALDELDGRPQTRVSPDEVKALIDGWLHAELFEDASTRDPPWSEKHELVILRQEAAWKPDTVLRCLDHAPAVGHVDAVGEFSLTDVTEFDLRRMALDKLYGDADARHRTQDESVAAQHVEELFARNGLPVARFTEPFERATRLMLKAHRDLLKVMRERDAIGWRPDLDDDPAEELLGKLAPLNLSTGAPVVVSDPSEERLSSVETAYLAEERKTLSPGRLKDFLAAFKSLRTWLESDPPLSALTSRRLGEYRADLAQMPSNAHKRPEYRNLSMRLQVEKSKSIGERRTLSATTIAGKYLTPVRLLLDWAKSTGRIETNPLNEIKPPRANRVKAVQRRAVFSTEEMQRLFDAPLFKGALGERGRGLYKPGPVLVDDWRYWIPIIALFTGARLNELCELQIANFGEQGGVSFFRIKDAKTDAGNRIVPIHMKLVELGLLARVSHHKLIGETALFPQLLPSSRGYYSDIPSKYFADLIDRYVSREPQYVFHGFRHTFITKMREANVPRELRTAIVGHEDDESHENYGNEPLSRLNDAVQSVDWSELDLSRIGLCASAPNAETVAPVRKGRAASPQATKS